MSDSVISTAGVTADPGPTSEPVVSGVQVRSVHTRELMEVAQLLCESFYPQHGVWTWTLPLLRMGIYQDLQTRFSTRPIQYSCLVGMQSTTTADLAHLELVGTVEVAVRSLSPWLLAPPVPYISNLAVAAAHRRHGVGEHLLRTCEQMVRQWGGKAIYLHVLKSNITAQHLYTRVGYRHDPVYSPWWVPRLNCSRRLLLCKQL